MLRPVHAYVMACRYGYALAKILKFCFVFLFCELKLLHATNPLSFAYFHPGRSPTPTITKKMLTWM